MRIKIKRILGILPAFVLIMFLIPIPASADDFVPPGPFYILSDDETKVFHVIPPWIEDLVTDDFPATGLYYNTDPLILIYLLESPFEGSVSGFVWEQDFIFSRDMRYFVWIPVTNAVTLFDTAETIALVFYANGIVQRTYMISDLVHDANAVHWSTTMAMWIYDRNDIIFDPETNRLTIETIDRRTYVFDITSGEIIGFIHSAPMFSLLQIIFTAGIILIGITFSRVKFNTRKSPQSPYR